MTRISDIAKAMNLSEATVSNAFTGKGRMKPETREAIFACARQMGYQFKSRGASAAKKKHLIAVTESFDIGFVTPILSGITDEAASLGITIPFFSLGISDALEVREPDISELNRRIRKLLDGLDFEVSGVLYIAQYARRMDGLLDGLSVPAVFAFCSREDGRDVIHYDDHQGARLAVNALISEGRERIAMISGPINSIGMYLRSTGYQHALMEHQLPYDPRLVRVGDWDEESGYELTSALLSEDLAIDAIFAQNDLIGVGAAKAIREKGLTIPDDISIIGFDDSYACRMCDPALTSIRPPFYEIGREAARRLAGAVENNVLQSNAASSDTATSSAAGNSKTGVTTLLPCELIRRGSTR